MAKKIIQPVADWVAIKRISPETKTEGGIDLPEAAIKKQDAGVVYATGPEATGLEEGDKVVWQKRAGQEVEIRGETFLMLKPNQVFFKVPK